MGMNTKGHMFTVLSAAMALWLYIVPQVLQIVHLHMYSFRSTSINLNTTLFFFKYMMQGWRNSSLVKNACCITKKAWIQIPAYTWEVCCTYNLNPRAVTEKTAGSLGLTGSLSSSGFFRDPVLHTHMRIHTHTHTKSIYPSLPVSWYVNILKIRNKAACIY